jgi:SpoVK/Ycf46/Vps4 family AAA+-type ATPase
VATGEIATLVRRVDGSDILEISFPRDDEVQLYVASDWLLEKIDRGEVEPGATLRVCRRREIAFDSIPQPQGLTHYKHLCTDPVPDVVVGRDLGSPPRFIAETLEHARQYMTQPQLMQAYHLRACMTRMLVGPSGTGKTYSIQALWNGLYQLMAEVTETSVDQLPPRVMRLRLPEVLSKWLGESDKRLSRFFDEAEQLAGEKFATPDGREFDLPVLIIFEECEGLARQRGTDHDAIYDRIQTTLLQRLDQTSQTLRDKLIIALFSTNVPWLLDSATARRFGDSVEKFGRLNRRSFCEVLRKHLRGLPIQSHNGTSQDGLERQLAEQLTTWLYCPNAAGQGVVELTYMGDANPVTRRMCDFLTPALVERAVQEAAGRACRLQRAGQGRPGLSASLLGASIESQVKAIVDRLRRENVGDYLDLPEGARATNVRKIERSAPSLPLQLLRDDEL